jgi:hypothetical protein
MVLARRVRRRLLLPPGWVALGFLLLLGCQALQPWRGQLKLWNVMQLTMPPIKADTNYWRFSNAQAENTLRHGFNPYVTPLPTIAASTLQKMRPWHDVEFSGNHLADFLNAATAESATLKIIADTGHAGGVRIRFLPGATYTNLVKVLDIMSYTNQQKYFLDIYHQPTTLYAITNVPLPHNSEPLLMCGCIRIAPPKPVEYTFQQLLIGFEQEVVSLKKQPWRLPILLFTIISVMSVNRLLNNTCRR